ncbi:mechanosensitive ion channel family protein [Paraburkholderia acidisoli]|uniref:Small-conductance mechanosensitive channel n=1 Tax=Paraburkholderia acidisoli TaxID=2571748 RepID=A0A7Z2GKF4_9BURK|nr:mechanosensitive ion channel family protein [Paraburkholderia acidisoli]QGZ63064.1 mechanosensitive ion channel [Paraburkholderia acidisoli]
MNDPLFAGFVLIAIDIAIWRCAWPRNEVARLVARLAVYAALSALLFSSGLSPFSHAAYGASREQRVLGQMLEIIWWLTGARLLTVVLDTLFLPKTWRRQRLFEDVFGAVTFLAAIVAALGFVLELPIRGLVATSGALAVVLGLAIQSTLSDVFAGIVINTTEPYEVGNWVAIDGVEGKVLEMNWRATHLLTSEGNVMIVPNAVAAKAKISNSSRPPTLHGLSVTLDVTPEARPAVVLDALASALKGVRAALADPAPFAHIKSTGPQSFQYEATLYVDDMGKKLAASNELYDLCYRNLAAAGVALRPLGEPYAADKADAPAAARVRLLRGLDLFAALAPEELERLAAQLARKAYASGEVVLASGAVPLALSIVESGVLSAAASEDGRPSEVRRLGPGDAVGEMELLAGLPARLAFTTLTRAVVYQLGKDDLSTVLKRNPDAAHSMCQLLARREHAIDANERAAALPPSDPSFFHWLLDQVRKLHDLAL